MLLLLLLANLVEAKEPPFRQEYDLHESLDVAEAGKFPCAADVDRTKEIASAKLMEMGINPKKKIKKPEFDHLLVRITAGRDAVVLRLLGNISPEQSGKKKYLMTEAQALCSPVTGKFELLSIVVSE